MATPIIFVQNQRESGAVKVFVSNNRHEQGVQKVWVTNNKYERGVIKCFLVDKERDAQLKIYICKNKYE